jgi:hypothetical protein
VVYPEWEARAVYTDFEDFNAYVYYSTRSAALDVVIWCLGPYVDDTRPYGAARIALARLTRWLVRKWYRIED